MVARLTEKSAPSPRLEEAASNLDRLVDSLSHAARSDESCYRSYRTAMSLPKSSDVEKAARREAMQDALVRAAESPLRAVDLMRSAALQGLTVAELGTLHALSDVTTARHLLLAGARGCGENVAVNLELIKDRSVVERLTAELTRLLEEIDLATDKLLITVRSRH
jgi:formiminotetrahydrofolate cyclodeaminase